MKAKWPSIRIVLSPTWEIAPSGCPRWTEDGLWRLLKLGRHHPDDRAPINGEVDDMLWVHAPTAEMKVEVGSRTVCGVTNGVDRGERKGRLWGKDGVQVS